MGAHPKEMKTTSNRLAFRVMAAPVTLWHQPKYPHINEWMKKTHTMECHLAITKNEILSFITMRIKLKNIRRTPELENRARIQSKQLQYKMHTSQARPGACTNVE